MIFQEHFEAVTDKRQEWKVKHKLLEIIVMTEPFPEKRTQKVKKKWNDSRGIRYLWLCNGEAKISLKTRGGNPTQGRVRADGVVEDFQIGKDIALRRRPGWIVF